MQLITGKEAAKILGGSKPIPQSTLAYWRRIGYGPEYIKLGRTYRYPLEGLHRFLDQNTH